MEGRAELIVVGAAQVVAATGADEFAAELGEALGAVGAVDAVVLGWSFCFDLDDAALAIGFVGFHTGRVSRFLRVE